MWTNQGKPNGQPMSDDLRTRIAAALRTMTGDLTYEAMADAVIRELQPELVFARYHKEYCR